MKDRTLNPKSSRRQFIVGAAALSSHLLLPQSGNSQSSIKTTAKPNMKASLDLDRFVADCITANQETQAQDAIKEVLQQAVSSPKDMLAALGEPNKTGIQILYAAETLTIFNASWTPQMNLLPHSHLMWALIGIYTGREDNIMWKRNQHNAIEAYGAEALFEGDVAALPDDAIHSVTNPLQRFTGGLHIYGGDFFHTTRSQWDPESLTEEPSDGPAIKAMFASENKRLNLD